MSNYILYLHKQSVNRLVIILTTLFAISTHAYSQLLWQISGNNVNSKSYIIATDKITPVGFLDSIPNLFHIFNKCNTLIIEMQYNDSILQKTLIENAVLNDTLTLQDIYTINEYHEISEAIKMYLNMQPNQINRLKPIYLNELIINQLLENWSNYKPDYTIDIFFQMLAYDTGKKIVGLDNTGEIIYMLFERESLDWQKQELLRTIRTPEKEIKQAKTISTYYQNGKLNDIAYQVAMPDNQTNISYTDYKIYCERNAEWVKKLAPYLKDGEVIIALNCIYLGGDDGLINQLRKKGYKVKAVN